MTKIGGVGVIAFISRGFVGMSTVIRFSGEQGARVGADYRVKFLIEQEERRRGGVAWLGKAKRVREVCHGES